MPASAFLWCHLCCQVTKWIDCCQWCRFEGIKHNMINIHPMNSSQINISLIRNHSPPLSGNYVANFSGNSLPTLSFMITYICSKVFLEMIYGDLIWKQEEIYVCDGPPIANNCSNGVFAMCAHICQ